MAWTVPRTFVTDEFMTASMFNTNVRDDVGEAWREIELLSNGITGATNSAVYSVSAGSVVAAFTSRTYPGYPILISCRASRLVSNVGNWAVLGVSDGTPGTTSPWAPLMQTSTEQSGTGELEITPTPGVHVFNVVIWGGNGGIASLAAGQGLAWQARLMEKAGP
jgi:hypothetical protein